jgi:hypothetical protein
MAASMLRIQLHTAGVLMQQQAVLGTAPGMAVVATAEVLTQQQSR